MGRRRINPPLNVYMNGRFVGKLNRQTSGAIDFKYDHSWLEWSNSMAISFSLPLREERYIGEPVMAVFENLLPDNDTIRRKISESIHAGGIDAFTLLSAVGRDCVGALQFLPEGVDPGPSGVVKGDPIDDSEISHMLRNLATSPLGLSEGEDFRISLAGAQEKTALLFFNGRWHKPLGSTATTHILKPQIGQLPNGIDLSESVENEFLCLKLTKELGLPSANVEMIPFGGRKVLVVTRFDRLWTSDGRLLRLPQEDCCQALGVPPTRKYESDHGPGIKDLLSLLKASDNPEDDQKMFLKTMIVFWLIGATDGHAKNFSLHLKPGGGFRLTPLYDVISAQPSVDRGQIQKNKMKLAMSVGKSRHYVVSTIVPRHFLETAELAAIDKSLVEKSFEDILLTADKAIKNVKVSLPNGFPAHILGSILEGFEKRLKILHQSLP